MPSHRLIAAFGHSKYFLRALGFEIVNTLFRRWTATESPKPALRHSRWIALSRCSIHFFPCLVFLFLLPLNYSAMYVGPGFSYSHSNGLFLVLFQIGAKLLEIGCVASLTTVVLHVLRHDLIRNGVPLGLLGSGIFFSQANCFWSPEMLVGAWHCVRNWRMLRLFLVIVLAGSLALLIAPSAAVLLQPQSQNVPAGGTTYYLPVTPNELWPSEVNESDERSECFGEYSDRNIVCASAGFESIRSFFLNFNASFIVPSFMYGKHSMSPLEVHGLAGKIPRLLSSGTVSGWARETSILQPNAMTATLQDFLTGDWLNATRHWVGSRMSAVSEYRYADQRLSSVITTSPAVLARCAPAQDVSAGQVEVYFPVKYWVNRPLKPSETGSTQWQDNPMPLNITLSERNISNNVQFEWITLPTDQFGAVSGGMLLHFPVKALNTSWVVIPCSMSASWFSGEITSDSLTNGAAWSVTESGKSWADIRVDLDASSAEAHKYRRLISLSEGWIQSLIPSAPGENSKNSSKPATILERLLSDVGFSTLLDDMRAHGQSRVNKSTNRCVLQPSDPTETDVDRLIRRECDNGGKHMLLELILASVFANGLSRYGIYRAFEPSSMNSSDNLFQWELQPLPKTSNYWASLLSNKPGHNAILPAPANSGYVDLQMRVEVVGYAWYASSSSTYLATAVVVTYMLLATAQTVWVLKNGVTSSSWDTVTELLALALRSPVSDALRGSGAGIERLVTYGRLTRVRTMKEEGEERLVLLIDGEKKYLKEGEKVERAPGRTFRSVEVDSEYL